MMRYAIDDWVVDTNQADFLFAVEKKKFTSLYYQHGTIFFAAREIDGVKQFSARVSRADVFNAAIAAGKMDSSLERRLHLEAPPESDPFTESE